MCEISSLCLTPCCTALVLQLCSSTYFILPWAMRLIGEFMSEVTSLLQPQWKSINSWAAAQSFNSRLDKEWFFRRQLNLLNSYFWKNWIKLVKIPRGEKSGKSISKLKIFVSFDIWEFVLGCIISFNIEEQNFSTPYWKHCYRFPNSSRFLPKMGKGVGEL